MLLGTVYYTRQSRNTVINTVDYDSSVHEQFARGEILNVFTIWEGYSYKVPVYDMYSIKTCLKNSINQVSSVLRRS